MTDDIARLGLAIDSRPVTDAVAALDKLPGAARGAGSSVSALEKIVATATREFENFTRSTKTGALVLFEKEVKSATAAVNDMTSIGTRRLDELRARWNPLYAVGQRYKEQLNDLRDAHQQGAISDKEFAAAKERLKTTTQATVAIFERQSVATKQVAAQTGLARHEMINLSRQVQDVGVSLVSGQSPFMVLAQQGTQIADVFGSSNGSLRGFGAQLAGLITPMRALVGITAAVGAGAYFMNRAWSESEKKFDDVARSAGTTMGVLHSLETVAAGKGIEQSEFLDFAEKLGSLVYQANNNMGGLATVLQANGMHAKTFSEYLERAADVIKNATSDQQRLSLLQQMGLPATMQMVRFLSQGADGIRRAADEAAKFGDGANINLIAKAREFDETWDRTWRDWVNRAKRSFVEVKAGFSDFNDTVTQFYLRNNPALRAPVQNYAIKSRGTPLSQDVNEIYRGIGAFKNEDGSEDPATIRARISLDQQRIGLLGNLASVTDLVRQKENELALAGLNHVSVSDKQRKAILAYTEASALGVIAIRQQADAARIEGDTVSMGVGKAAAYRAEQERLADFRLRGIKLTQDQTNAIRAEADALGLATQRAAERRMSSDVAFFGAQLGRTDTEQQVAAAMRSLYGDEYLSHMNSAIAGQMRLNDALSQTKDLGKSALSGLVRDFRDGKTAAEAFGNVLNKIADKLIDIGTDQFMSGLLKQSGGLSSSFFGGSIISSSGLGGQISGLYHSGRGPGDADRNFRIVHPAVFADAPRFHTGIGPGERAAVIRDDESVLTPGQMRQLAPVGRGGAVTINLMNAPAGTTATASAQQDGNGGLRLDVMLRTAQDDTNADLISRGDSATNREFERRYGLRPVL